MYKRRKVFSKIGEKTFSTTEFQTQKEFAAKKEESKKEKDYKDASKKVQDKAGKAAGILGAATMGSVGASIGTKLGFDAAEKTKKGKKLERVIDKARDKWAEETVNGSKGAVNSSKRLKKLTDKSLKRGNVAGAIGAGLGAAALGTAGYKMNNAIIKKQIKKGDEKFLKTATDEQLEKATKDINENFGSKKKNKK